MKKAGRNDPCPCGSGKKFKKCCEETRSSTKFSASRVTLGPVEQSEKDRGLASLFRSNLFHFAPSSEVSSEKISSATQSNA